MTLTSRSLMWVMMVQHKTSDRYLTSGKVSTRSIHRFKRYRLLKTLTKNFNILSNADAGADANTDADAVVTAIALSVLSYSELINCLTLCSHPFAAIDVRFDFVFLIIHVTIFCLVEMLIIHSWYKFFVYAQKHQGGCALYWHAIFVCKQWNRNLTSGARIVNNNNDDDSAIKTVNNERYL